MKRTWKQSEFHERMAWVRVNVLKHRFMTDAAEFYGERAGTYRTWEQSKADNGRVPDIEKIRELARKAGVSWEWLAFGEGQPQDPAQGDDELFAMAEHIKGRMDDIPSDQRENVMRAINGILDAYSKVS